MHPTIHTHLDLKEFWLENEKALGQKPAERNRIPIQFSMDDHYLIETLGIPSTIRYYRDFSYRMTVHREINDLLEAHLGKRFFTEQPCEPPEAVRFEVLMGAHWELREGGTPWLESTVTDERDLDKIIANAEKLDMRQVAFPEDFTAKRNAWESETGTPVRMGGTFARGPATMATSILGTTKTCLFMMDEPERMDAFFDVVGRKLVEWHEAQMVATGNTERSGYALTDDNCCLFPPRQYERFCAPVLDRLFKAFAPERAHRRYQHSDSEMSHLMPILHNLDVNVVNLGPTIHPLAIRKAMPNAEIQGQLPPMLLRNGTRKDIFSMVKRDIEAVGADGRLVCCTAGSMAGGTPIENFLAYMEAVHEYGQRGM